MAIGQFNKSNAGAKAPMKTAPARKSKWAGVKSSKPRDPVIHKGDYRLRILNGDPGRTGEWFKVHFRIEAQAEGQSMHADGDEVVVLFNTVNDPGQARCKAFFVGAAGYDDDESYDAYDPDGAKIDAFFNGDDSDLTNRLVDVRVTRGKEMKDDPTDYYRECEWSPVADAEQGA